MQQYGPGLGNLGNLIDAAKAHVATFTEQHIRPLQELAAKAKADTAADSDPAVSAIVQQLAEAALADLKKSVTDAFKPPPKPPADPGPAS